MKLSKEVREQRISVAVQYKSGKISTEDAMKILGISKTAFSSMVYYHSDEIKPLLTELDSKVYTCDLCRNVFPSRIAISAHRVQIHKLSPTTCYVCDVQLSSENTISAQWANRTYICKPCNRKYYNSKNAEKRKMVLDHYGNSRCACCNESASQFLTIDHVNGGGGKHRKELGMDRQAGQWFYRWLIRNGYPDGFQVLCWNCQEAKNFYGKCPHGDLHVYKPDPMGCCT